MPHKRRVEAQIIQHPSDVFQPDPSMSVDSHSFSPIDSEILQVTAPNSQQV